MGKYTLSIPSKGNLTGYRAERIAERVTATLAERIGHYSKSYYDKLKVDKQKEIKPDIHDSVFQIRYKKMPFAHIEIQESSGITLIKIDMYEESPVPAHLQDDMIDSLEAALLNELVVN